MTRPNLRGRYLAVAFAVVGLGTLAAQRTQPPQLPGAAPLAPGAWAVSPERASQRTGVKYMRPHPGPSANAKTLRTARLAARAADVAPLALAALGARRVSAVPAGLSKEPDAATKQRVAQQFEQAPLHFEANQGQVGGGTKFFSRGPGYTLFLTPQEAVLSLQSVVPDSKKSKDSKGAKPQPASTGAVPGDRAKPAPVKMRTSVVRMKLLGANRNPQVAGEKALPGRVNYFQGNDQSQWRTDVKTFGRVHYESVYPGIDMVYYGKQRELEYDFIVAPHVDPNRIRLSFAGAKQMHLNARGDLVLQTLGGEVVQQAPIVYQEVGGQRRRIAGRYKLHDARAGESQSAARTVSFEIGRYNRSLPLVIDPVLGYSTYLGGSNTDEGFGIAVDGAGNAYVTGYTNSTNFPTLNAAQTALAGSRHDAFVTKLSPSGTLLYSTYLGGSGEELGYGIAVDGAGNAYVTGTTESTGTTLSTNFPTLNAAQTANAGGSDAFVTKLSPSGTLLYSTYLGGSSFDVGYGIGVDGAGNAYVTGYTNSTDFPTLNAAQTANAGISDAIVTKLSPSGTLLYSTYLGGSGEDVGYGIGVDGAGNAYVTGRTESANFPTLNAAQTANAGGIGFDAIVTKLSPSGILLYSTYLGGSSEDVGIGIGVDGAGNAYVTGGTESTDFPTLNAAQTAYAGGSDAFVTKLSPSGTLLYSTYLGGSSFDVGYGIGVDGAGNAYVTGYTNSTNFPTLNAAQTANAGNDDAIVTKLSPSGTLLYSTYLGGSNIDVGHGIAVDGAGNAYVTGRTESANFPTLNAAQTAYAGNRDAFVTKLVNVPPVLDLNGGGEGIDFSATFTEDAGPTPIVDAGALTVTDADNTTLTSATITLTTRPDGAAEVLAATASGDILKGDIIYTPGTSVLQITREAPIADYQAVLRSVTYNNTSQNPNTTARTIDFTVSDGGLSSAVATTTLSVTAVNDAPVVTLPGLPGASVSYSEGAGPVFVDTGATVSDVDSTNFDTGTLTIDFAPAQANDDDRFDFSNQGNAAGEIGVTDTTVSFGPTVIGTKSGGAGSTPLVVTFNANATRAAVEALLRRLTFANVSDTPPSGSRNIRVVLTDGDGGTSATATKPVTITAVNDAPAITAPATISVTEDVASPLVGLAFSDSDAGANAVEVTLAVPAGSGTLGTTSGAGVTITGSGTRLLTLTGSISNLNAFIAASKVTFTTASNATADVALSVGINDGGNSGGAAQRDDATVTLQVLAVNDAPTLTDPPDVNIDEDAAQQTVNLSGITAGGGESQTLSVSATSNNPTLIANPTVTYTSPSATGTLRFTPTADRSGTAIITVTVMDNGGTANGGVDTFSQQFTVTVAAENDVPVLSGIESSTLAFVENEATTPISANIVVADVDSPQLAGATVAITSNFASGEDVLGFTNQNGISGAFNASNGVLTLSGTATVAQYQAALRSVTFRNTSDNPSTSPRTITFTVRDSGGASDSVSRSVSVASVNDAPVVVNQNRGTPEDTPLAITFTASDVDSSSFTFEIVSGPSNGTLSGSGATRTYTPNLNFVGSDSFTFRASDGTSNSNIATVTITVGGQNDAPVAVNDTASTSEDVPVSIQVLANDTDDENDPLTVQSVAVTSSTNGTVSISADKKSVLFTPAAEFSGTGIFSYVANDGALDSNAAVVMVQVLAANDAPFALADSYNVSAFAPRTLQVPAPGVLANDSDAEGDALQAILQTSTSKGELNFKTDGSFSYTPGALFSGTDTFTYVAFDGQAYSTPVTVALSVPTPRDTTPPLVSLAGPAVRRLPLLPLARGSAVDVYVTRESGIVPSSGLRSVVLRLQNGAGLFWNGRGYQSTPFDLRTRLIERSFFAMDAALPPRKPAASPDERFIYTAIATDGAGNRATTQQFIFVDTTPPGLAITTPGAGINNTVRVSRLTSIGGRASSAVKVEVSLRNSAGLFFDGTSFVARPVFLRASLSGVNYTLSLPTNLNLAPGSYLISVRAFDEVANIASASRTVIVQSSAAR